MGMPSSLSQCQLKGYRKEGAGNGQVSALLQGDQAQTQLLAPGSPFPGETKPHKDPIPLPLPA